MYLYILYLCISIAPLYLYISMCSATVPVHLNHLGDSGAVAPLRAQHEPFLVVAQRLLAALQLPPVQFHSQARPTYRPTFVPEYAPVGDVVVPAAVTDEAAAEVAAAAILGIATPVGGRVAGPTIPPPLPVPLPHSPGGSDGEPLASLSTLNVT